MKDEIVKDIAIATADAALSSIPIIGPFLSKYWELAKGRVANKNMNAWIELVEERFSEIEFKLDDLTDDEFFFSCIQSTTVAAMRSYQQEKRAYLANALYNSSISVDIDQEKIALALSFIDKYPLVALKVLSLWSRRNKPRNNMDVFQYISKSIPEVDKEFATTLMKMLLSDGLIIADQFNLMNSSGFHQIGVTDMGNTILNLIADK